MNKFFLFLTYSKRMPNKTIQVIDLTHQQKKQKKTKPVASKQRIQVIDLTHQQQNKKKT